MKRLAEGELYPPTPSVFSARVRQTLSGLPDEKPGHWGRVAVLVALALVLMSTLALAANSFGVLDFLRGFSAAPVTHLDSAGELGRRDLATIRRQETELCVRNLVFDGTRLYILYAITDLDGKPILDREQDLTEQLGEWYSITPAAKRDGFAGMVKVAEIDGVETPFGCYFFPGEQPGEMLYYMEFDLRDRQLGPTFEVALAAVMNEHGWTAVPDELRFQVANEGFAHNRAFEQVGAPVRLGGGTVRLTRMVVTPLRAYLRFELVLDENVPYKTRVELQREWFDGRVLDAQGNALARGSGGGFYEGNPREDYADVILLQSASGQETLTIPIKEGAR